MTNAVSPDIVRGRLTPGEIDKIEMFAAFGRKPGWVAARLNRHPATINFAFHRLGLKAPIAQTRDYMRRNGVRVRSFDADEDVFIQALRCQGYSTPKIAAIVTRRTGHGRTAATIGIRLRMLANLAEISA